MLLFFVRSGLSFNLGALTDTLGASGSVPLLLVGLLYFAGRIAGKYAGAYVGALLAGKGKGVRNYLGLALIPQAGVAIGLAAMGARTLGGEGHLPQGAPGRRRRLRRLPHRPGAARRVRDEGADGHP